MTGVVLCAGEPLIALAPLAGSAREATELSVGAAGAELNVAVHLARLGVPARFAGRVGEDPFGHRLRDVLIAEGVDVGPLVLDPERPTGVYVKDPGPAGTTVYYHRRGSAATRFGELAPGALDDVDLVHLTGITPALSTTCADLVTGLLRDPRTRVSFDVNHRPALWSAAAAAGPLLTLARLADIVFVGLDEAARLWHTGSPDEVRALLPDVPELVVKDAGHAATAHLAGGTVREPALPVDVVEPVGAGDAFAAGYLAARLTDLPVPGALRQGHVLAAAVMTANSDQGQAPDRRLLTAARTGDGWPTAGQAPPSP